MNSKECEFLIDCRENPKFVDTKKLCQFADELEAEIVLPKLEVENVWQIKLTVLEKEKQNHEDIEERYGLNSEYAFIDKSLEPSFVIPLIYALQYIGLKRDDHVLELGCHQGQMLKFIRQSVSEDVYPSLKYTGIDYSKSVIEEAEKKYNSKHFRFICDDLNAMNSQMVAKCQALISIGTLQCTSLDGPAVFRKFFQECLQKQGKILLAFPNSRYVEGKLVYGAKSKNYTRPDLSLLIKDIMYYKKYLQQHRYRVWISGKNYLFLAAYYQG